MRRTHVGLKLVQFINVDSVSFCCSGNQTFKLAELAAGLRSLEGCDTAGKLAFIVPGWMDDGDEGWVLELVYSEWKALGSAIITINTFSIVTQSICRCAAAPWWS